MNDIVVKLTEITNENYKDKFANELLTLQTVVELNNTLEVNKLTNEEINNIKARIICLQEIIFNFDTNIQNAITEAAAAFDLAGEQKDLVNIFTATDKIIYSREWNRLAPIHKMIKIKEYFEFMPDSEFKVKLISDLETIVNSKKMKDPEHIVYDNILQKITNIQCLSINKDSNYNVSFDL